MDQSATILTDRPVPRCAALARDSVVDDIAQPTTLTSTPHSLAEQDAPTLRRRRWLCIAYAFPPINRSGTHRTLGFVEQLTQRGWDATVLTVLPDRESLDPDLLDRVPTTTTVVQARSIDLIASLKRIVGAGADTGRLTETRRHNTMVNPHIPVNVNTEASESPPTPRTPRTNHPGNRIFRRTAAWLHRVIDWTTWLLITPDKQLGWLIPAIRQGLRAIRRNRPEIIYSTSPCMTAHLIALVLSRVTRIPWVADFRDPWRGNPFRAIPHPSLDRWDAWLERLVLRSANHITCTSPSTAHLIAPPTEPFAHVANAPWRANDHAQRCTTILNGFDAAAIDRVAPLRLTPPAVFTVVHAGEFYGRRSPHACFRALKQTLATTAGNPRVHLLLIGPDTFDGRPLQAIVRDYELDASVTILGRATHADALRYVRGGDAALLVGAAGDGCNLQIPGKLFEYLGLRRPIIAAIAPHSPVVDILRQARAVAWVCNPDDAQGLTLGLTRFARRECAPDPDAWSGVDQFNRAQSADQLLRVFHHLTLTRATQSPLRKSQTRRGGQRK